MDIFTHLRLRRRQSEGTVSVEKITSKIIPIIKIRRSDNPLIFIMEVLISGKSVVWNQGHGRLPPIIINKQNN